MVKFKIGDKVRRINTSNTGASHSYLNSVGVITGIDYYGSISFDGNNYTYTPEDFVLVDKLFKTPHKHAEVIKAWADGAEIEYRFKGIQWMPLKPVPRWEEEFDYRVKPEPKPDIVIEKHVYISDACYTIIPNKTDFVANVRFTFDPETRQLKNVESV